MLLNHWSEHHIRSPLVYNNPNILKTVVINEMHPGRLTWILQIHPFGNLENDLRTIHLQDNNDVQNVHLQGCKLLLCHWSLHIPPSPRTDIHPSQRRSATPFRHVSPPPLGIPGGTPRFRSDPRSHGGWKGGLFWGGSRDPPGNLTMIRKLPTPPEFPLKKWETRMGNWCFWM